MTTPFIIDEKKIKEKIYVIGNGWGSYYFVKNLDKNKFIPIIISPNKKVLNTPKLVERIFDKNAIVEFENPHATKIIDELEEIDIEKKVLITKTGNKYPYTKVVLSIGSESNDFGIKGVNENTYKFKTIQDADNLRITIQNTLSKHDTRTISNILDILENQHTFQPKQNIQNNDNLKKTPLNSNIYIIGSGVTGIELASKIDKLQLFNIKIIEGLDTILPGFKLKTQTDIINNLKNSSMIDLHLAHKVISIDNKNINTFNTIKTINTSNKTKENTIFKYNSSDIIIWTGGIKFNGYNKTNLFHSLNSITSNKITSRGIEVNSDFSISDDKSAGIYCIGDMVSNKGPPTAQNAQNQGVWLAKYFNTKFNLEWLKNNIYEIKSKGKIVHLNNIRYLESEYYCGPISTNKIPKSNELIDWLIENLER